jgi:hypothetical protein
MKIIFTKNEIENLSPFSDDQLKEHGIYSREIKPIDINDFFFWKNKKGHYALGFESKNYKYLKFEFNRTSFLPEDKYGIHFLDVMSWDEVPFVDENGEVSNFKVPVAKREILLQPENDEENDMLRSRIVEYSRWNHYIVFVPFVEIEDCPSSDSFIDEPESDVEYTFED